MPSSVSPTMRRAMPLYRKAKARWVSSVMAKPLPSDMVTRVSSASSGMVSSMSRRVISRSCSMVWPMVSSSSCMSLRARSTWPRLCSMTARPRLQPGF